MTEEGAITGCGCTLDAKVLIDRVREWRALGARAIDRRHTPGLVVTTFAPDPEIAQRCEQLITAEAACCPSLSFELTQRDDAIELQLRYPAEAAGMLEHVLAGSDLAMDAT